MFTKLLLTLGVIGVAWLVLRNRSRRSQLPAAGQPARLMPPASKTSERMPRLAAYALIVCMLLASGVVLYLQWRDEYRIVTVRVVNTQTGQTLTYEARRGDVEQHQFQTLDGRTVYVAEIERIEVGSVAGPQ
ncbi:MAG: hypothetical protein PVG22_07565 [Chromatiales bacterium]|jgi:hypothetical protein